MTPTFGRRAKRFASWIFAASIAGAITSSAAAFAGPTHELVVRDGERIQTVNVEVIERTETELIVKVYVGKIAAKRTYPIGEVVQLTDLNITPQAEAETATASSAFVGDGEERVYILNLSGQFGRDISTTPFLKSMDEARDAGATTLILKFDNNWIPFEGGHEEAYDDQHRLNEFFPAQTFIEAMKSQMLTWDQKPRVIAWVNRAMGGLAFAVMPIEDVYFTEDGKMGAIGNLDNLGGNADEQVRRKWQRVYETQAEGWLAVGGHEMQIADAMMREHVKMWFRETDDGVEFWNEYDRNEALDPAIAEIQGWTMLTDTGQGDEEDTDRQVVRGEGNDELTLTSDIALRLGLSSGTADTIEDLLWELDLLDATIIDDSDGDGYADGADKQFNRWSRSLETAFIQIGKFWREHANADNDAERLRALRRLYGLYERYAEVLDPGEGGPQRARIRHMIEDLERRR